MRVKNSEMLNKNWGWNVTKNPQETITLILPDRELNYKEQMQIRELIVMIDEMNVDFYIKGENEYSPALNAILDAGASPLTVWDVFVKGDIVFIDDEEFEEYDEYEKEEVFYTDDGNMFVILE